MPWPKSHRELTLGLGRQLRVRTAKRCNRERSASMIRSLEVFEVVKRRSWCAGISRLSATAAPITLSSITVNEEAVLGSTTRFGR